MVTSDVHGARGLDYRAPRGSEPPSPTSALQSLAGSRHRSAPCEDLVGAEGKDKVRKGAVLHVMSLRGGLQTPWFSTHANSSSTWALVVKFQA